VTLVDEKWSTLADWVSLLLLESILDPFTSLLNVALRLVGLSIDFELVIASGLPNGLFDVALGYLGQVLRFVFVSHSHSISLSSKTGRSLSGKLQTFLSTCLVRV
jgi:hypothetical protein